MSGTPRAPIVALGEAHDARAFGGKAAGLARLVRAGLPVPAGVALDTHTVGEIAAGADGRALVAAAKSLGHLLAVRSSAVGEDGAAASFAGQHRTELAVPVADVCEAVVSVAASARTASAAAYRRRMGVTGCVATGAVVQAMLAPETAGVMFTRDPRPARAGRAERVVEASYGLGEAVVAGLVVPDGYRLAPGGVLVDVRIGDKDVRVVAAAGGGTRQVAVDLPLARARALDDAELAELDRLAAACERVFDGPCDVEWAVERGTVWLLQARPVTGRP